MSGTSETIQVLHVDDVVDVAEVTEAYLEQESGRIDVETAASAAEGYDVLAERDVDCVVSDYDMPGEDGIEFLEGVRERYDDLPFILFTGKGSEEVASEAISAGVTDYLQKGTGTDQYALLANRIENAVDQARAEAAVEQRERRLRTVLDNLPYPAFVIDEDGVYQLANAAHAAFHDRTVGEIEGVAASELLAADHYESFRASLDAVLESGDPQQAAEAAVENTDGERRFFDSRLIPIEPVDTDKQVVLGVTVDVTELVEQRREIEAKRRQLQAVVDTAPAAIVMKRVDGDYLLVNETAREWAGVDSDVPVSALSGADLFPSAALDELREQAVQAIEANERVTSELDLPGEEETRTIRVRLRPQYDDEGDPEALCAVAVDVTGREERRRELERLESMVDAIQDAAAIFGADGRYEVVNDYLVDYYDRPREDILGETSPLVELIREAGADDEDPFAALVAGEREQYHGEFELEFAGNDPQVADIKLTRLTIDGEFDGVVAIGRDVTDRRERERELERQNERLEEFASVVSHDLRNPLNVATTRVDLARRDCDSEHLPVAARSLDRMADLIDDLLALARGGELTVDPEPVDLAVVAHRSWGTIESTGATLDVETPGDVVADPDALRQLVENLLENAVVHGSKSDGSAADESRPSATGEPADVRGGTAGMGTSGDEIPEGGGAGDLTVRVGTLSEGGFYVADDGQGIPPAERDRVFEAGYSTAAEGTGFGLRVVERIAESHGWDVDVTDGEAGGARFEVTGVEVA